MKKNLNANSSKSIFNFHCMIASKKEKEKWATSNYKLSTCYCWYNVGHVKKIIYVAFFFFFNHLPNPTYNVPSAQAVFSLDMSNYLK